MLFKKDGPCLQHLYFTLHLQILGCQPTFLGIFGTGKEMTLTMALNHGKSAKVTEFGGNENVHFQLCFDKSHGSQNRAPQNPMTAYTILHLSPLKSPFCCNPPIFEQPELCSPSTCGGAGSGTLPRAMVNFKSCLSLHSSEDGQLTLEDLSSCSSLVW